MVGPRTRPTGVVTFLLSDVEGSTQLWQSSADRALRALVGLERLVAEHADAHNGYLQREQGEGDSALVAFAKPGDAVECALAIQRSLAPEHWDGGMAITTRIALHTGEVEIADDSYRGIEIHRCARIRGLGHGGQTLLSERTARVVGGSLPAGASLRELGEYPLRGLDRPERVYQLCSPELPESFPPLRVDARTSADGTFRVLGPLEVEGPDGPLELGGIKARIVLASLVLHANRVVPTATLIENVWGPSPPEQAEKTLRSYVTALRKALAPLRPAGGTSKVVVAQKPGYILRVRPEALDLFQFHRLRDEARSARRAHDLVRASARLREALDLWHGPSLADLALEPFAAQPTRELENLRLGAFEERIDVDLERGLTGQLVPELEALVREHPDRERLRGQLSRARGSWPGGASPTSPAIPPATVPAAIAEIAPPPFVGRATELDALEALLSETRRGGRRLAFVRGESGAGKTRLLAELAERAGSAGVAVLYGRADDESLVPFQPFVEALRPCVASLPPEVLDDALHSLGPELAILLPELATIIPEWGQVARLEPDIARYHMFEAVAGFVDAVASARPMLLLLDDLHWADAATLQLLRRVVRDRERGQLLVVGAYRSASPGAASPVAPDLRAHGKEVDAHLGLDGLAPEEVSAFLAAWTGSRLPAELGPALHERTEGNPFLLVETLRYQAERGEPLGSRTTLADVASRSGVPDAVRALIVRRLDDLDERSVQTLTAAAVIGRRFDLTLLGTIVEFGEIEVVDALDRAAGAGFVREQVGAPEWYQFAHALARDAIVDTMSASRRIRLHRAVGNAIEAFGDEERDARLPDLARHFTAAAPLGSAEREKAVDYAVRSGDRAMQGLAFEEAADLYRSALSTLADFARPDDEVECRVLLRLREAQNTAGDEAGAVASLERLLVLTGDRPAAGGLSFLLEPGSWRPPPWGHETGGPSS